MRLAFHTRIKAIIRAKRTSKTAKPWVLEMPNTHSHTRRKRTLARELKNRVNSPGFDRLASLYDETLPMDNVGRRLSAIRELAAKHWDFRRGKMRYEVDFSTVSPGESVIDLNNTRVQRTIVAAAADFGLTAPSHSSRDAYDGLIVPGGAELSPYLRLKYALEQTGPGGKPLRFGWIALLGCDRIVSKDEQGKVKAYAPQAKTEFDLMVAAAEKLLDLTLLRDANMRKVGYRYDRETWPHVRYYKDVSGTRVLIFNAPIPAGDVKANTGHTYDFLRAASGSRLTKGKHILLSSTAHVRAFQHVDAERLLSLPAGISIETIGFSKHNYSINGVTSESSPVHLPKELLQEIKSYVDALVKMNHALKQTKKEHETTSRMHPSDAR
jgi:hypothetical protein